VYKRFVALVLGLSSLGDAGLLEKDCTQNKAYLVKTFYEGTAGYVAGEFIFIFWLVVIHTNNSQCSSLILQQMYRTEMIMKQTGETAQQNTINEARQRTNESNEDELSESSNSSEGGDKGGRKKKKKKKTEQIAEGDVEESDEEDNDEQRQQKTTSVDDDSQSVSESEKWRLCPSK